MKKTLLLAVALALAAALWVGSGELFGSTDAPPAVETAAATEPVTLSLVRVRVLSAEPYTDAIVVLGRTEPSRAVTVRAETQGRVEDVLVAEGAAVEAGAAIARLAEDDRRARLAEAEALLDQRAIELNAASSLAKEGYQTQIRAAEMFALTEEARARLAAIRLDLARITVHAPFDGVLERRAVEIGDFVSVGDEVAYVVDLDPALVVAEVTERDIGSIAVGGTAVARMVTGQTVAGTIRYVSRQADPATHTFRVELEVPNPDGRVVAGITAELSVPLAAIEAHLVTPAVLTLDEDGTVGVKAVEATGRVVFHPVTLVADGPEGVWVAGLPASATVIVVGQEFVTAGQQVTTVPAE